MLSMASEPRPLCILLCEHVNLYLALQCSVLKSMAHAVSLGRQGSLWGPMWLACYNDICFLKLLQNSCPCICPHRRPQSMVPSGVAPRSPCLHLRMQLRPRLVGLKEVAGVRGIERRSYSAQQLVHTALHACLKCLPQMLHRHSTQ